MKVLITGASGGIGRAAAELFLERGHEVHGLDLAPYPGGGPAARSAADAGEPGSAADAENAACGIEGGRYVHHVCDVTDPASFPEDLKPEIVINCAGVQTDTGIGDAAGRIPAEKIAEYAARDIDVNLMGTINITEKYAFGNGNIKAVVNIGSASGHTGSEFPVYAASKGGVIAYTKNIALRLAPKATANSIDPGGVVTELNDPVMKDEEKWNRIMELTPMKRWAQPREIAEWIYFVAVVNRSMTGQNLLIDGGEAGSATFVW